jgi:hypothetical protein
MLHSCNIIIAGAALRVPTFVILGQLILPFDQCLQHHDGKRRDPPEAQRGEDDRRERGQRGVHYLPRLRDAPEAAQRGAIFDQHVRRGQILTTT